MGPMLTGRDRLAFRDVSHFYTPLYWFVAEQTQQHGWRAAFWNPLDQTGIPLAGETTTAVYYPVRALVYAWRTSPETLMAWYVTIHLLIASLAAFGLARRARLRPAAAACVSIAYPLSGAVLFLATNPPYLVSAAWLPIAMTWLLPHRDQSLHRSKSSSLWIAFSLAMMTLGGDPPTVLHVLLCVAMVRSLRSIFERPTLRECWHALRGDAVILAIAGGLAAPQLAASIDWSLQSDRQNIRDPSETFAYSVPAWRAVELVLPGATGTPWPINTRWDRWSLARNPRDPHLALWTPTIYLGAMLPMLSMLAVGRRRMDGRASVWTIVLVFSAWCSTGHFGGLYGVLVDWLPGYQSLRYPSKWLPFVSLSLAMMMGLGVQRAVRIRRMKSWVFPAMVSVCWIAVVGGGGWWLIGRLNLDPVELADPFWGPPRIDLVRDGFVRSIFHAIVVTTVAIGVMSLPILTRKHRVGWLSVLLAVDLMIAHCHLVPRVNRQSETLRRSELMLAPETFPQTFSWMRMRDGWPEDWSMTSSEDRMVDVEVRARAAWWGRWHLSEHQAVFNSSPSIVAAELPLFWRAAHSVASELPKGEFAAFWTNVASWLQLNERATESPGTVSNDDRGKNARHEAERLHRTIVTCELSTLNQWTRWLRRVHEGGGVVPLCIPNAAIVNSQDGDVWLSRPIFQDGHWHAAIRSAKASDAESPWRTLTVWKADGIHQAIALPPGHWTVRFWYRPWWQTSVQCIAAGSWLAMLVLVLWQRPPAVSPTPPSDRR